MRQRPAIRVPIAMRDPLTRAESRRYLVILLIGVAALIAFSAFLRLAFLNEPTRFDHVQFTSPYVLNRATRDDLVIVAEQVRITAAGSVGGDLSVVGSDVQIEGAIAGDLTVVSEHVTVAPGARIGGDAALMGDSILLDGTVAGDVRLNGQVASIAEAADISGDVTACVDTIAAAFPTTCDESQRLKPFEALIRLRDQGLMASDGSEIVSELLGLAILGFIYSGGAALGATLFPARLAAVRAALRARGGSLRLCWQTGLGVYALLIGGVALTSIVLAVVPPLGGILALALIVLAGGALMLAALGWAAAGGGLGKWLVVRQPRGGIFASAAYTAVGAFAFVLLFAALLLLPFGDLLAFLLALLLTAPLLGAAALTLRG